MLNEVNGMVLDNEERCIGTFFGKPLYRRMYQTTSPSQANVQMTIVNDPNLNEIDKVINFSYALHSDLGDGATYPTNYYSVISTSEFSMCALLQHNVGINMVVKSAYLTNCEVIIILDYTKK